MTWYSAWMFFTVLPKQKKRCVTPKIWSLGWKLWLIFNIHGPQCMLAQGEAVSIWLQMKMGPIPVKYACLPPLAEDLVTNRSTHSRQILWRLAPKWGVHALEMCSCRAAEISVGAYLNCVKYLSGMSTVCTPYIVCECLDADEVQNSSGKGCSSSSS